MAHDVFISYAHQDKVVAEQITYELERQGIKCWVAPRDIPAGVAYGEALITAIYASKLFLLVLSAPSIKSKQVLREVDRAINKDIPLLAFQIEDTPLFGAMEYYLSPIHMLKSYPPPIEAHLDNLIDHVKERLLFDDNTTNGVNAANNHRSSRTDAADKATQQQTKTGSLFHINYQFLYPYLPVNTEELAQFAISFTSREDIALKPPPKIPSHLTLVLDVSGSMNVPNKYPLLLEAIPHLVNALSDEDYLTIILFSQWSDTVVSQSIAESRSRINDITKQIDASGAKFGSMTLLADALQEAIHEIAHFRKDKPKYLNRLYILTDGDMHDAEECCQLNPQLRTLEAEVNSYGFGEKFAFETMKKIMEGVPGGTVKPILDTKMVEQTFAHIGNLAGRIICQDAELTFEYAEKVIAGDAFRFQPGMQYYGMVDPMTKRFNVKIGALERDRTYTFLLEGSLRPSNQKDQVVGNAKLRYRKEDNWEEIEAVAIARRTEDEWRAKKVNKSVEEILQAVEALRNKDSGVKLDSLKARLDIYRRMGADSSQINLLETSIGRIERGERISTDQAIGIEADMGTQAGPPSGASQKYLESLKHTPTEEGLPPPPPSNG